MRRGAGGVDDGEVRRQGVGEREEAEAVAEAAQRSESGVDGRVDEELEADADEAEGGHGEADAAGGHAQAAGEAEGGSLPGVGGRRRVRGIEAGGGEVDEPEVVEGADVEGHDRVAEKGAEDVSGPDSGQWQFPSGFRFLGGRFGEARFELVGVKPGAVCWGVQVVVGVDGCVAVSVAAENVTEGVGDGVAEAETQVWLVSYGFERLRVCKSGAGEHLSSVAYLFQPENDSYSGDEQKHRTHQIG